jgi:hypothetical protein
MANEDEIRFQIIKEMLDEFPQLHKRVKEYLASVHKGEWEENSHRS